MGALFDTGPNSTVWVKIDIFVMTTYIHSRKAKGNTLAARGDAGRHHACKQQGKSGYKVGNGSTWVYSAGSLGHIIRMLFALRAPRFLLVTLHITSSNYSSSSIADTHYKTSYPHYHICSSCNAITHYNIIYYLLHHIIVSSPRNVIKH